MRTCARPAIVAAAVAAVVALAVPAAGQNARFLAKEDIILYGIGLKVEPAQQTVPKDIATIVSTYLQAPVLPDNVPPFAPDAEVRATLRGPSFATAQELVVSPNAPFTIPPLTVPGLHTLENIRLVSGGQVLLRAMPEHVTIDVIEKLLITQITARALTADEIREKGIVFDKSDFQAYNFSAAFAVEDRKVEIKFPVILPVPGASLLQAPGVSLSQIAAPSLVTLQTVIPDALRQLELQVPNLSVGGFSLKIDDVKGKDLIVPPIPGVIVIPGDIGFLNQFFSVMLLVGNVAPGGSNLVVTDLTAQIVLPAGNDAVVGSVDDPLTIARTAQGESPRIQAIVQPGPDGKLGTVDDVLSLAPGETGNAEFLVEGRREGSHVIEMEITGTLHGLPVGPVTVRGRAAGAVLVRNPTFTLTFTHPEIVNVGEAYTLDVTITNTSTSPANFVSLNLYPHNVSGATIVGDSSRQVDSIPPGDSATVTFDLISRRTGRVTSATLDSNENVAGRFQLKTAVVGELGVPLSPDTLVLPRQAGSLPSELRMAALGLLGKAWAVATAPAAALPKDLQRFSKKIVLDRAIGVAEAGVRHSLGEPLRDTAAQLAMDFAGNEYQSLAERYPLPADQEYHGQNLSGFDNLRRKSIRGDAFAQAIADLLSPGLETLGPLPFHADVERKWAYRPAHVSVLISAPAGALPFTISIVDAQGGTTGGVDPAGKVVKQIPFSDLLSFSAPSRGTWAQMAVLSAPPAGEYAIRLDRAAGAQDDTPFTLSLAFPDAAGTITLVSFSALDAHHQPALQQAAGEPYRFSFQLFADGVPIQGEPVAPADESLGDLTPAVLGAVQQADADKIGCADDPEGSGAAFPAGRVIAVLFSAEVTAESAQDKFKAEDITNYTIDGNKVVGVALQPGGRVVFLALRDPIGPFVQRSLLVSGVVDRRGRALAAVAVPIQSTIGEQGGVVSGRVLNADGTPVPFADVRLAYLLSCPEFAGDATRVIPISSKTADAQGRYSWDFVARGLTDLIVAADPVNDDSRDIRFNVARSGQRLNVDIVFLGRGTLTGVTRGEDGMPLEGTEIRVTSLTDNSQYGAKTGADGRFTFPRVPVGNLFIEAVNVQAVAQTSLSEHIPAAGATVERDLVLLTLEQQPVVVKTGDVTGHVLRADGATPVADVPVIVYYKHLSQPGVACAGNPPPDECPIAVGRTDAAGAFGFTAVASGELRLQTFDQVAYQQGDARVVLAADGAQDVNLLLSGGFGTVAGVVLDSAGAPLAGARVGGGLSLTTTDAGGHFVLTDVPAGRRSIVAVSDALGSSGQASVDVPAGGAVNVTVVLEGRGSIGGVVSDITGAPVSGIEVFVFAVGPRQTINVIGTATTDATGAYLVSRVPLGQLYQVSAFRSDFSDGNITSAILRFPGQSFRADIRFRGGNAGRVEGTVFDSDGNTPLKALVGVSGEQVVIAGGRVGVRFQHVPNFRIVETGLSGAYSLSGLWPGAFTLQAAGQFSPDPISLEGSLAPPGATINMDLRLQATSQIGGIVYQPDGVTPVGAGVLVKYKSDVFRTICTEGGLGEPQCEAIPQGIQSENVVTDAAGRFWLPIVNAGVFTLTVDDRTPDGQMTGKLAQVKGSVRPGEKAELAVRLRGLGELTVQVLGSDGVTPIVGARVEVTQLDYPQPTGEPDDPYTRKVVTIATDAAGSAVFGGGDALLEGQLAISAIDLQGNGYSGRASAAIKQDGDRVLVKVYVDDAVGTVYGRVYAPDGAPVANAEVVIAAGGDPFAYTLTDASGVFRQERIPLGAFTVETFEARTGRTGSASGTIYYRDDEVPVTVFQTALGVVTGTVLEAGSLAPLKGWQVTLEQTSPSGRARPSLVTTTGLDGTYSFPGTSIGPFRLTAEKRDVSGAAQARGGVTRPGQIVDVPLLVTIARTLSGSVRGLVLNPDGTPAGNSEIVLVDARGRAYPAVADATGNFLVEQVALGRFTVDAASQTTLNAGDASGDLSFDGDIASITVVMQGISHITGVVEYADGSRAANIQVTLRGWPSPGCPRAPGSGGEDAPLEEATCVAFSGADGSFSFSNVPAATFSVTATDPVRDLKGMAGGPVVVGGANHVRVVLEPSGRMTGRARFSNGAPAPGIVVELVAGDRHLFAPTRADGTFAFDAVPMTTYVVTLQDPIGPGRARRTGQMTGDLALGDIVLDNAAPSVISTIPAASAIGVRRDQAITITFSEPVDPGTVTQANVYLLGPSGPVTATLQLGTGDTVATLTPLAQLLAETRYSVRVKEIQDRIGHTMNVEYAASFTTEDVTPPAAIDIDPGPSTGGVTIYTTVRLKYSEPIDPSKFRGPPVAVSSAGGGLDGRIDFAFGNTVLIFTPARPLTESTEYRVQVESATDLAGNAQPQGLDFTFVTTDRTAPVILSLSAPNEGRVIENATTTVTAEVGTTHDVAFVDFFINDAMAFADRAAPFAMTLLAKPEFGRPGDTIKVSAIATDTSGNRGVAPVETSLSVILDQPPAAVVTVDKQTAANGDLVRATVHAVDDLSLSQIGYRAQTGRPQDAGTRAVIGSLTDHSEVFSFNVPTDAAPGSTIRVQGSASDSKGQVVQAAPVAVLVLDSVSPAVTITGATTGARVYPGQETRAVVTAQDLGGIASVTFTVGGVTARTETRTVDPAQNSIVTTFVFTIPANATPADRVTLDAVAVDQAGNSGVAPRVTLPVADTTPPVITLGTETGSLQAPAGATVNVVADATDQTVVARIELSVRGAMTLDDARQPSPPTNSAHEVFPLQIPESAPEGATIALLARAIDQSGNVSAWAPLTLTVVSQIAVSLPSSVILNAGDAADIEVSLESPAPAGGTLVELRSTSTNVATVTAAVPFAAGERLKHATISGVSGGTISVEALVRGVPRASMTVVVQGGVVTGTVVDVDFNPIPGALLTFNEAVSAFSDADGNYSVVGVVGPLVSLKAQDPATHRRGHATGELNVTNGFLHGLNVVLMPAGAIRGTVTTTDGATPAGPGVLVQIFDAQDTNEPYRTTSTDGTSAYEFPFVQFGSYVIRVFSGGRLLGQSSVTVTSDEEMIVPVSYLGAGTVTGTVRGGDGTPLANAPVRFHTSSILGYTSIETNADSAGVFRFDEVLIGDFTVQAQDLVSHLAGTVFGSVKRNGDVVERDIYLAAYGSVHGIVRRADGVTASGARVTLTTGLTTVTDVDGAYSFAVVPIGTFTISVHDAGTRGRGLAIGELTAAGQSVAVDVTLFPQGSLIVTVTDASGTPVPGAWVSVTATNGQVEDSVRATAGDDGIAVLDRVLAGSAAIEAFSGGLKGAASTSLAAGETKGVTIRLQPTASIAGTIYEPNGQNTVTAGRVELCCTQWGWTSTPIAPDGTYRFDGLSLSEYQLAARDTSGGLRARRDSVPLTQKGQVASVDLTFIGLGTVYGQVLNPDESPASNLGVTVRSAAPDFGRAFGARTDPNGNYVAAGVPVGPFTVGTGDASRQLLGQGGGTLPQHGDSVRVDILLQSSAITFPVMLWDANNFRVDVQQNGSAEPLYHAGGALLDVGASGTFTRFTGASIGTSELAGRQVVAHEENLSGLNVVRKVYVPADGYFTRYLEILTNTGALPVTVDLRITSGVGDARTVVSTSSGDDVFDVWTAVNPDNWITLEGFYGGGAAAFAFAGPGAPLHARYGAYISELGELAYQWNGVTVLPGQSVALLHFVVQQVNEGAARASAERLEQLPPEALAGLALDEITAIVNFAVPAGGASALPPLPRLTGVVSGRALDADASALAGARVSFTSTNVLFSRTHIVETDASGSFRFTGALAVNGESVAIPVDGFTLQAVHPATGVDSPVVNGSFAPEQTTASVDVTFSNTGIVRGTVQRHNGTAVTVGHVALTADGFRQTTPITSGSTYRITGVRGGAYTVTALVPSASCSNLIGSVSVEVVNGASVVADLTIQPTGSLQGAVSRGGGTPAASARVTLTADNFSCTTSADTNGAYAFPDVPAGTYTLSAVDPATAFGTMPVNAVVGPDQVTIANLSFIAIGSAAGVVTDQAGQPVPAGTTVELHSANVQFPRFLKTVTGTNGSYRIDGVPEGAFTIVARWNQAWGEVSGTIATDGEVATVNVVLVTNIVTMPVTHRDGNAAPFRILQDGRVSGGLQDVFSGAAGQSGALTLDLVAGGVVHRFTGAPTAIGERGGRQILITQPGVGGLDVTRKIYVPRDGYFARYVEVLTNPSDAPVTVDLRVLANLGSEYLGGMEVIATSSGDATLSVLDAENPDRWLIADDQTDTDPHATSSLPALAFVFDGAGGAERVGEADYTVAGAVGQLLYRWNNVTVPPHSSIAYLHFAVQQLSRAAATAAAERLAQLPPEALEGVSAEDLDALRNFAAPEGGVSTVAPLPPLTGTITGRVLASDRVTPVLNGAVRFKSDHVLFGRTHSVSVNWEGRFSIGPLFNDNDLPRPVPVHSFTVSASDSVFGIWSPWTPGGFPAGTTMANVDVVFTNTGIAQGRVTYAGGLAASGGTVRFVGGSIERTASIRADGTYSVAMLPPGTYEVRVTVPHSQGTGLTGTGTATITADQVVSADITLEPTGSVRGTVRRATQPPTAAGGVRVEVTRSGFSRATNTDATGAYAFSDLPLGTFAVAAIEPNTNIASSASVSVAENQATTQDLTLPITGIVVGVVTIENNGGPAAGRTVQLRSTNPLFGGFRSAVSGVDGAYRIAGVPEGRFTVLVNDTATLMYGDASGAIVTDGAEVTANIVLVSNSVNLPLNRYDGNNFLFNVAPDGGNHTGTNRIFEGLNSTERGAVLLEIVNGGTAARFTGNWVGRTEQGKRQIAIQQAGIAGVDVTRKVYVPGAYFARYLDILNNPADVPVTVDVRVTTRLGYAYGECYWWCCYCTFYKNPSLMATSSGDTTLAANDAAPDRWAIFDDTDADGDASGTFPAVAFVFDGPGAAEHAATATYETPNVGVLTYGWNTVTIPAHGSVAYLHFVAQQTSRAAAQASAERLEQLPPEALEGLSEDELIAIRNFAVPPNGISTVPPLPEMNGTVKGTVFDSDTTTALPWADVRFKSANTLFGRTLSFWANEVGAFEFGSYAGDPDTGANARMVPLEAFTLAARHPDTSAWSSDVSGSFAETCAERTACQDIVFTTTGIVHGVVTLNGQPVSGASVSVERSSPYVYRTTTTNESGRFSLSGFTPGALDVRTFIPRANSNYGLQARTQVTIVAGQQVEANLEVGPVGAISGVVRTGAGGVPSSIQVNVQSRFNYFGTIFSAWAYTDTTTGAYAFADLPPGSYDVYAYEPRTSTQSKATVDVAAGAVTAVDLTLAAVGSIQVQVNFARGVAAPGMRVSIKHAGTSGYFNDVGTTDANGQRTITKVPSGTFTIDVSHPSNSNYGSQVTGTLTTEGEVVSVTLTMPPIGTLSGTVRRTNGTLAGGDYIYLHKEGVPTYSYVGYSYIDYYTAAYSLPIVPVGEPVYLRTCKYPWPACVTSPTFTLTADGESQVVDLTLPPLATLAVTALNADGTAAANLRVLSKDDLRPNFELRGYTDSAGKLAIANMPGESYTLRLQDLNTGMNLVDQTGKVLPADDLTTIPVTIVRSPRGTIVGHVYAADGTTPVPGAQVKLLNAWDRIQIGSATTAGPDGAFTFTNVGPGSAGFVVWAGAPVQSGSPVLVAESPGQITTQGETATVDVTIPAIAGTIQGRLVAADGATLVAGGMVRIVDPATGVTIAQQSTATGAFAISNVFVRATGAWLTGYAPGNVVTAQQMVTLQSQGETASVDITLPVVRGTITGRVVAGDRATPIPDVPVALRELSGQTTVTRWTAADGTYSFDDVFVGTSGFVIAVYNSSASLWVERQSVLASPGARILVDVVVPVSAIRGRVTFADGTAVADLSVLVIGSDGKSRWAETDGLNGGYIVLGTPPGAYTITAQDYRTSLTATASGDLPSETASVSVDLTLPETGSVAVRLVDEAGTPIQYEYVVLITPGVEDFQYGSSTGSTGTAVFTGVPVGPVSVQTEVYAGGGYRYAITSGVLTAGATLTLDLAPVPTGTVSGRLYKSDGTTPLASEWVTLRAFAGGGPAGSYWGDARTDANGRFQFASVPSGTAYLSATDPDRYDVMGTAVVNVPENGAVTGDITLGNAVNLYENYYLDGTDGFRYDLYYAGQLQYGGSTDGRLDDAYNYSHYLTVNDDSYYNNTDAGTLELDGRQVHLSQDLETSLLMSRKIYVPASGGFARYLEIVHNPTAVTLPATVLIETSMGASSNTHFAVTPDATRRTYAIVTDARAASSIPAVGLVFAGAGAVPTPAAVEFREGSYYPTYQWRTSIGPGETAIFMHFTLQREPTDVAAAQAQAEALVNLTDPQALAGLTAEELAAIRNFTLADLVRGAIDGVVRAADGTTPIAGALIQLFDAPNGRRIASTTSGADGSYHFANVATSASGFILRASSPTDPSIVTEHAGTLTGGADPLSLPVTLNVRTGEVSGVIYAADGSTPLTVARIEIARAAGAPALTSSTPGPDGAYRIAGLAMSPDGFVVRAYVPALPPVEQQAVFATQGHALTMDFTLNVTWGAVVGTVYAGDGQTPVPAVVELRAGTSRIASKSTDSGGAFAFDNILLPSGGFTVAGAYNNDGTPVEGTVDASLSVPGTTVDADVTLPLSIVRGQLTHADGTIPGSVSVVFMGADNRARWAQAGENGQFRLFGLPVGPFRVTAQDYTSGLSVTTTGEVVQVSQPVVLDLRLPPTSAVVARVTNGGVAVPSVSVFLVASGANFTRSATTNANGEVTFERIPVGPVLARASFSGGAGILQVGATGALVEGATLTLDLLPLPTGVVAGLYTMADGTPAAGMLVSASSFADAGLGSWTGSATADASGRYQFSGVPAGAVTVWGLDANGYPVAAGSGALLTGTTLTVDVQAGTAANLAGTRYYLDGADGFRYDIDDRGRIYYGGQIDVGGSAYYRAYSLSVNGESFSPQVSGARLEENGRQLALGPDGDFLVTRRKVFVPSAGGFARYVEFVTNPSPIAVTARVEQLVGFSGGGCGGSYEYVVGPASTDNSYAVLSQGTFAPALGFVFGGTGTGVVKPLINTTEWYGGVWYEWSTTIPAGATVAFMHFAIQRESMDAAAAQSQAAALVNLTDPNALAGLTAAERASIVNFVLPAEPEGLDDPVEPSEFSELWESLAPFAEGDLGWQFELPRQ